MFELDAGSGTHSAAAFALGRWGAEVPSIPTSKSPLPQHDWYVNRHGMTMIKIHPGTFRMGDLDPARTSLAHAPHKVTLSESFFICDREVSVGLFKKFVDATAPSGEQCLLADDEISPTPGHPMQTVSWDRAVEFCNWLSQTEGRTPCYRRLEVAGESGRQEWEWSEGNGYRLPTDAEWEYACRAGTLTRFSFGGESPILSEYGVSSNNRRVPAAVGGTLLPNPWGLFDVHGNVWEWCWDWYSEFAGDADETDPRCPAQRFTR